MSQASDGTRKGNEIYYSILLLEYDSSDGQVIDIKMRDDAEPRGYVERQEGSVEARPDREGDPWKTA